VPGSDPLADALERHRPLRAVAYRMLGSVSEVDDAVQETWMIRLGRGDVCDADSLRGVADTQWSHARVWSWNQS
jgi:RNA polymerase sigma-70 factor (ECF subfamily)